jgi:hypothetical protein
MPKLSMYNAVDALPRLLSNMEHILKKGEANAKDREIDPDVFLNARLAPDMLPLKKQVKIAAELAKNAPYRIAGIEAPNYDTSPETFEEAYELLARARKDCKAVSEADLNGKENREFSVKMGPTERDFTGISYLSGFSLPNVHFHVTTAYNILRHNGVPLGKADYFGGIS